MNNGFIAKNKILENVSRIIIILLLIYNIYYNFKNEIKINNQDTTNQIVSELEKEPYIERLKKIYELLKIDEKHDDTNWINFLTEETLKDYGIGKYELNERLERANILERLKKLSQKNNMEENQKNIQDFLDKEYENIQQIIKNEKDKTRLTDEEIEIIINNWNRIINKYEKNSN